MPALTPFATKSTPRARAFSNLIFAQECERRHLNAERRTDLAEDVFRAVVAFLMVRRTRFPHLTATLPDRFVNDRLPCSTVRNLRRAAVRALDARLCPPPAKPRLARPPAGRRQPRVIFSHFMVFVPKEGLARRRTVGQARSAGYPSVSAWTAALTAQPMPTAQLVNERIDALLVLVRKAGEHSEYASRCARAHAALLEEARARMLAQVAA